jgi:hypothetical protein
MIVLGSYLFYCLLGDEAWKRMLAYAGESRQVELALHFDSTASELGGLPWEMMCSPEGYLVAHPKPRVAISRLLTPIQMPAEAHLPAPLKVLFVVGADMNDVHIEPAAEYLGLLRRLEAKGRWLTSRVLLRATVDDVRNELSHFRPSVVHFICHGTDDSKIELAGDEPTDGPVALGGTQLLALLRDPDKQELPAVVVLNACYSAGVPAALETVPLATELVVGGVPVVVGMAGRVSDHACRLLTRRFYEALLHGECVVTATAEGRRAGFIELGDPYETVDWAFPTIFLADQVSPFLTVDAEHGDWDWLHAAARDYRRINNPKAFCGRLEILGDAYRELVRPAKTMGRRVLAVEVPQLHEPVGRREQYGKTRLLQELAGQAVQEGHVPCLPAGLEPPSNLLQAVVGIFRASLVTRRLLRLNRTPHSDVVDYASLDLDTASLAAPPHVDPQAAFLRHVGYLYQEAGKRPSTPSRDAEAIRVVLANDLAKLAEEAREQLPGARVLVLLDEVHRYDAGTQDLLNLLDGTGLGTPEDPVPVVLAFSRVTDVQLASATLALTSFLEDEPSHVNFVPLGPFLPPQDERWPYQQFLLHYKVPVVVNEKMAQHASDLFNDLYEATRGIPSYLQLPNESVEIIVRTNLRPYIGLLKHADDQAILENAQRQKAS